MSYLREVLRFDYDSDEGIYLCKFIYYAKKSGHSLAPGLMRLCMTAFSVINQDGFESLLDDAHTFLYLDRLQPFVSEADEAAGVASDKSGVLHNSFQVKQFLTIPIHELTLTALSEMVDVWYNREANQCFKEGEIDGFRVFAELMELMNYLGQFYNLELWRFLNATDCCVMKEGFVDFCMDKLGCCYRSDGSGWSVRGVTVMVHSTESELTSNTTDLVYYANSVCCGDWFGYLLIISHNYFAHKKCSKVLSDFIGTDVRHLSPAAIMACLSGWLEHINTNYCHGELDDNLCMIAELVKLLDHLGGEHFWFQETGEPPLSRLTRRQVFGDTTADATSPGR